MHSHFVQAEVTTGGNGYVTILSVVNILTEKAVTKIFLPKEKWKWMPRMVTWKKFDLKKKNKQVLCVLSVQKSEKWIYGIDTLCSFEWKKFETRQEKAFPETSKIEWSRRTVCIVFCYVWTHNFCTQALRSVLEYCLMFTHATKKR